MDFVGGYSLFFFFFFKMEEDFECLYTCSKCNTFLFIDPGWTNLGVSFITVCECQKQLRITNKVIDLGVDKYTEAFQLVKALEIKLANQFIDYYVDNTFKQIDVLIIETQYEKFKLNNKLMTIIETFLYTRYNIGKQYKIAPIPLRKYYGLENTRNHKANKLINQAYVADKENKLIFGGYMYSEDVADTILLFNYFVDHHGKRIKKKIADWTANLNEEKNTE